MTAKPPLFHHHSSTHPTNPPPTPTVPNGSCTTILNPISRSQKSWGFGFFFLINFKSFSLLQLTVTCIMLAMYISRYLMLSLALEMHRSTIPNRDLTVGESGSYKRVQAARPWCAYLPYWRRLLPQTWESDTEANGSLRCRLVANSNAATN